MKKLILSLAALAMMAFAFTGCEDVPAPYDLPEPSKDTTVVVNPTGSGTADDPYNVAAALAKIDGQNINENSTPFYVKGKISMIKEINTEQYGNATYYISDDGKYDQAGIGKTQLYIYQSMYLGKAKFTTEDQIKVGDEVIIYGPWVKYQGENSSSTTLETANKGASYIYSLNGKIEQPKESIKNTPETAYTVAQALELVSNGKAGSDSVYVKGIVTTDKISYNSKYNSITYYISDDGKTDNHLQIYSGKGLNGAAFSSKDDIKPGQTVVVYGLLKDYNGKAEIDKENKLIIISGNGGSTDTPSTPTGETEVEIAASSLGLGNAAEIGTVKLSNGITITANTGSGSNSPKFYTAGNGTIRMYPGNTLSISAGSKIASITVECDSYNGVNYTAEGKMSANAGKVSLSDLVYTISGINGQTVTITNSDSGSGAKTQLRIKTLKISYAK